MPAGTIDVRNIKKKCALCTSSSRALPCVIAGFKVVILGVSLRGACLEGLAEPTPKELCLHSTFGVGRFRIFLVSENFSEPGSAI